MARSMFWLLAAILLLNAAPAAADGVSIAELFAPPPSAEEAPPRTGPLAPRPRVQYGCKRVWRCDEQVCEWRRGCWGVYGYWEGPYYTSEFARRQWEKQGLPGRPPKGILPRSTTGR